MNACYQPVGVRRQPNRGTANFFLDRLREHVIAAAGVEFSFGGAGMRTFIITAVLLATAGVASAQTPFVYKPIDTNKALVQPTDAAAAATAGTTQNLLHKLSSGLGSAIEGNGFVKTVNNLLGKRAKALPPQAGRSALPQPSTFASTSYAHSFPAQMPVAHTFGSTPKVVLPVSPSAQR